jgi:hypothetical protein
MSVHMFMYVGLISMQMFMGKKIVNTLVDLRASAYVVLMWTSPKDGIMNKRQIKSVAKKPSWEEGRDWTERRPYRNIPESAFAPASLVHIVAYIL